MTSSAETGFTVLNDEKMKTRYIIGAAAVLLACTVSVSAQDRLWNLEQCIDYAVEHNLTVKAQEIARQQKDIDLNTAENSRIPDLSGSAGQNFSFGRGLSADNTYVNTNTASTSFSLGSSINVFNGFRTERTVKLRKLDLQAAVEDLEKARDDIRVAVMQAYFQILYAREIRKVAMRQVGIDSVQVERLRSMRMNGKADDAEVAQQEASLGQSRLTLTQAENSLGLALLDLAQLLELPSPDGFEVVSPDVVDIPVLSGSAEDIFAQAVDVRPAVKAEMLRLDAAEMNVAIAKSSLYPSVSLSGGIGTNWYKSSGYDAARFVSQMKNNFSQYVGVSLNVPIFSRFSVRNGIRSARLAGESQRIQLESVKKSLYKEIQQAWYNAVASQAKLRSCADAKKSAEESFRLVSAKYVNGKAAAAEFNDSRNSLMKASSDMVQALYENLFQVKLLDFYRGKPIGL